MKWRRALALVLSTGLLCGGPLGAAAGDPGRLEADADFLLGRWSDNCKLRSTRIFLRDGALRQQGLLRLVSESGDAQVAPVTLLAATRDGPGLVLEATTEQKGVRASARYTARIASHEKLELKHMLLCRGERCRSAALDVMWLRCGE